ncbi:MAG: hypothetical protein SFU27_07325 [Thermonemataceae bacterium]|nr:hypothetical protein [Thermonemataceae bacterium]
MKNQVFESRYVVCYQWDTLNIFEIIWFSESENVDEGELFELTEQMLANRKLQFVLTDTRHFSFPISPELQLEYGAYSTKKFIELGCQKLAVILPDELIANLSVQQLVEEVDDMHIAQKFETRYFKNTMEAKEWLTS